MKTLSLIIWHRLSLINHHWERKVLKNVDPKIWNVENVYFFKNQNLKHSFTIKIMRKNQKRF